VALALSATLAVTSCVGIPSSGPIGAGPEFGEVAQTDTIFNPLGPQPGADQLGILEGFIDAFTGTQGDYAVARQFLSSSFQAEWDPRHSVAIRTGSENFTTLANDNIEYSFMTRAGLDEYGSYATNPLETQTLSFRFVQEEGEWRISQAPPGIVLAESTFRTIFSKHSLYFYDLALVRLVPDPRWFPGGTTATRDRQTPMGHSNSGGPSRSHGQTAHRAPSGGHRPGPCATDGRLRVLHPGDAG